MCLHCSTNSMYSRFLSVMQETFFKVYLLVADVGYPPEKLCFLHNMEKLCNLFWVLSRKHGKSNSRMDSLETVWRSCGE